MAQENPKSPNAIPPRTSSYGLNGIPQKSVLRPLSEIDWISSSRRHQHTQSQPISLMSAFSPLKPQTPKSPKSPKSPPPTAKMLDDRMVPQRWTSEKEKILLGPYEYLAAHPGKEIRSQLIAAFNKWLNVPPESLAVITKVVGMLHTASLLVDDVEDSSTLRRGIPVANNIYGTPQTINSANYVYFLALRELQKLRTPHVIDIYTEELINLHRGQGLDLYWRDSLTCPTEAEYLEMVSNKTGGLFRLAIKLMQAESSSNINCLPLVNVIGLLYQVLDDHLNLSAYSSTKGLCEDLTEGKFSFPIIHAIRADPSNLVLMNILRQKTMDEEVKKFAVGYMEKTGSFEHSRKTIGELKDKACALIDELEKKANEEAGSSAIRAIVNNLKVPSIYSTGRASLAHES